MNEMYHTALKSKFDTKNVSPSKKIFGKRYLFFQNDIMQNGIPDEISECDVIYGEPPWPHGFKIFNKRTNVKDNRTYKDFADILGSEILRLKKPFFMTIGKTLLKMLPSHAGHCQIKLNGAESFMVWWFDKYNGPHKTNLSVCKELGQRYASM